MDCCLFTGTVYWNFIISAGNIMLIERCEADIHGKLAFSVSMTCLVLLWYLTERLCMNLARCCQI